MNSKPAPTMVIRMGSDNTVFIVILKTNPLFPGGVYWWTSYLQGECGRAACICIWFLCQCLHSFLLQWGQQQYLLPWLWELGELIRLKYFEKCLASVTLGYYLLSRWFPFPFISWMPAFQFLLVGGELGIYIKKKCGEKQICIHSNVNVKNHWNL